MDQHTPWSHHVKLDAHPVSASRARCFVRHQLSEHDLVHLSDDVELVVSELATNAMVHARTDFTVLLHGFVEPTLLLEVEDGSDVTPARIDAHILDIHGRGLAILDLLCRDWGIDALPNGKSVWAEFSL